MFYLFSLVSDTWVLPSLSLIVKPSNGREVGGDGSEGRRGGSWGEMCGMRQEVGSEERGRRDVGMDRWGLAAMGGWAAWKWMWFPAGPKLGQPLNNGAPESGGGRGCSLVHNAVNTPYLPRFFCLFSKSDLFQNSLLPLSRNRLPGFAAVPAGCSVSMRLWNGAFDFFFFFQGFSLGQVDDFQPTRRESRKAAVFVILLPSRVYTVCALRSPNHQFKRQMSSLLV